MEEVAAMYYRPLCLAWRWFEDWMFSIGIAKFYRIIFLCDESREIVWRIPFPRYTVGALGSFPAWNVCYHWVHEYFGECVFVCRMMQLRYSHRLCTTCSASLRHAANASYVRCMAHANSVQQLEMEFWLLLLLLLQIQCFCFAQRKHFGNLDTNRCRIPVDTGSGWEGVNTKQYSIFAHCLDYTIIHCYTLQHHHCS